MAPQFLSWKPAALLAYSWARAHKSPAFLGPIVSKCGTYLPRVVCVLAQHHGYMQDHGSSLSGLKSHSTRNSLAPCAPSSSLINWYGESVPTPCAFSEHSAWLMVCLTKLACLPHL